MTITLKDVNDLITLGMVEATNQDLLMSFKDRDYINRQDVDTWCSLVSEISDEELIAVYKALIHLERELNWIGGSVAGAIWIYRIIQQRGLDGNYELADFGLRNCDNQWVPFGKSYYGIRTISDYFKYQEEKAISKAGEKDHYKKLLKRVEGRKERRSKAISELRKLSKEERGQIRSELLKKYETATIIERLETIANDENYPPEYYPKNWIKIPTEEIQKLPMELIKALYDKLSTKTKADWKRFSQELQKIADDKQR